MEIVRDWWDWGRLLEPLLKMTGTFLLILPIAWDRERSTRIMGMRTFSLVAVASCGYVLVANQIAGSAPDAHARILQGLMTGIGFIGGGAILKEGPNVRGTATAASIWMTGALGAAVGYSEIELAVLMSAFNFLTLRVLTRSHEGGAPPEGGR